jgi:hypothetical protein
MKKLIVGISILCVLTALAEDTRKDDKGESYRVVSVSTYDGFCDMTIERVPTDGWYYNVADHLAQGLRAFHKCVVWNKGAILQGRLRKTSLWGKYQGATIVEIMGQDEKGKQKVFVYQVVGSTGAGLQKNNGALVSATSVEELIRTLQTTLKVNNPGTEFSVIVDGEKVILASTPSTLFAPLVNASEADVAETAKRFQEIFPVADMCKLGIRKMRFTSGQVGHDYPLDCK